MTNVFYFKVNLNKFGEMKLQAERDNKTFRNAVIVYLAGALIMFAGLIFLNNSLKKKVEIREKDLAKAKAELSSYVGQKDYLSVGDVNRLAQTFTNRIFWTRKLEALSNEIDRQLAIRKLNFSNGVLTLNGIIEVNESLKELLVINEFIDRLKANPDISNDFPEIKSGQVTRQVAKDTEILEFVIECYSKEALSNKKGPQQ